MIFREVRDDDLDAVAALWDACNLTRPWNPPGRDIALLRESGHGALLVAEAAGQVVGTVMVGHDGHRGWMYYVAVSPACRREGLGRRLVAAAEGWLGARGVRKAMLLVRPENAAVRGFYESLGYEEEQRVLMARWLKTD